MNVLVEKQRLDILANAISDKSGVPVTMTLDGMATAVDSIEIGSGSGGTPILQSKTATPTESAQTITADNGYDGLSSVEVGAISSTYVGSGITRRDDNDLYDDDEVVVVPAGYYAEQAIGYVMNGVEGTPTATKGTVSNHSVSVVPSVTNETGFIGGGTINGTAVTVTASELVSGTYNITTSGTHDVTNYATVTVSEASPYLDLSGEFYTENGRRMWRSVPYIEVSSQHGDTPGFIADGAHIDGSAWTTYAISSGTIITPSNSAQSIGGEYTMMEGAVTVEAIPSQYIIPSGTYNITTSGTHDVTNYASASVTFSTIYSGSSDPSSSTGVNGDIYIKVAT